MNRWMPIVFVLAECSASSAVLLRIDTQTLKVLDTWNIAPYGQPSVMDMDTECQRVLVLVR